MSSLISGYEYDIFISYRHKDNLPSHGYGRQADNDGWVTQFVADLQRELESTLKDDVSIYFDKNPIDGLHETNDVDDSLRIKSNVLFSFPSYPEPIATPTALPGKRNFLLFATSLPMTHSASKQNWPTEMFRAVFFPFESTSWIEKMSSSLKKKQGR